MTVRKWRGGSHITEEKAHLGQAEGLELLRRGDTSGKLVTICDAPQCALHPKFRVTLPQEPS